MGQPANRVNIYESEFSSINQRLNGNENLSNTNIAQIYSVQNNIWQVPYDGNSNDEFSQNIIPDQNQYILKGSSTPGVFSGINLYMGSSSIDIINNHIFDIYQNDSQLLIDRSDLSLIPYEGAHGIVWKVLVNGFDAQDEYASLDALGVGTHEFKVYFNRADGYYNVDPRTFLRSQPFRIQSEYSHRRGYLVSRW